MKFYIKDTNIPDNQKEILTRKVQELAPRISSARTKETKVQITKLNSEIELITTSNDILAWQQNLKRVPFKLSKKSYAQLVATFEERKNIILEYKLEIKLSILFSFSMLICIKLNQNLLSLHQDP